MTHILKLLLEVTYEMTTYNKLWEKKNWYWNLIFVINLIGGL
jgi:hypothetical protein